MRLFQCMCNSRLPQNMLKVPLRQPRLPFKLRDRVSGRSTSSDKKTCVQETINVINALTKYEYNTQYCQKEIVELRRAHQAQYEAWLNKKEQAKSGTIEPGQNLTGVRLNKFLRKFPEPRKTDH